MRRVSEPPELERALARIAADTGGELHVERSVRNVGPIPIKTADGFVNGRCPRCCFDRFTHSYGDELCRCAGCGATLDIDELSTSTDLGTEIEQFEAALRARFGDEHGLLGPGPRGMLWFQAASQALDEDDPDPSFPSPSI